MDTDRPPIVEHFCIDGLHGYKTIKLDFDTHVKIVIAENGAGKTTILSALNAFLTGDLSRLASIPFDLITCKLRPLESPLTLNKSSLAPSADIGNEEIVKLLQRRVSASTDDIVAYVSSHFYDESDKSWRDHEFAEILYDVTPWDWDEIQTRLQGLKTNYDLTMSDAALHVIEKVRDALADYEVLYLPTYRRVEKTLRVPTGPIRRYALRDIRRKKRPRPSDIQYGLQDVEQRLKELSEEIQKLTNIGYGRISTEIINDMLTGTFDITKTRDDPLPTFEELSRFLARVGTPAAQRDRVEAIYRKLDSTKDVQDYSQLRYFLGKLSKVVNQTSKLEAKIENFAKKSNVYLKSTGDPKELSYDPTMMELYVQNNLTKTKGRLNDLSSGEKQIVSLLAYLFLYEGNKIVLIDEPELSLSIPWQRKILPDIASSPDCSQMLAITHSPFIFDNELDDCGEPLDIKRKVQAQWTDEQ